MLGSAEVPSVSAFSIDPQGKCKAQLLSSSLGKQQQSSENLRPFSAHGF